MLKRNQDSFIIRRSDCSETLWFTPKQKSLDRTQISQLQPMAIRDGLEIARNIWWAADPLRRENQVNDPSQVNSAVASRATYIRRPIRR